MMSKLSDFVCPPVPIASVEQTATQSLRTAEGTDISMPTVIVIENLSGKSVRLADQQCAQGRWVCGPAAHLRDGQAMVLVAGQPPLTLGGVGVALLFEGPGFALSCCAEITVMRSMRALGILTDKEDRIAGTVFHAAVADPTSEAAEGKTRLGDLMLEWRGTAEVRLFSVYPSAKDEVVGKWRTIYAADLEAPSAYRLSAGSILTTVALQHGCLNRFLDAALCGALTDLNYAEDLQDASEIVEDFVRRDLKLAVQGVWAEYDTDQSGTLSESELQPFVSQFIAVFIHEAPGRIGELLVRQKQDPQHYSYNLADDAAVKIRSLVAALDTKALSQELFRNLWGVEGEVTKEEFTPAFLALMHKLLLPVKEAVLQAKAKEEKIEAQIEKETGQKREKPARPWGAAVRKRCECF